MIPPLKKSTSIIVSLLLLLLITEAHSQKAIELTNGKRKIIIREGKRVKYKLKSMFEDAARIKSISDSTIKFKDRTIPIYEFDEIGKKNPGSNFRGIFLTSLGGLAFITALQNLSSDGGPSCSSRTTTTTVDDEVYIGMAGFLAMAAVGVEILLTNTSKDLTNGWSMKIIDLNKKN